MIARFLAKRSYASFAIPMVIERSVQPVCLVPRLMV